MTAPAHDDELGQEQPFLSHLVELRDRLLHMVVAIVLVFLALFPFANDIYHLVAEPIRAALPEGSTMIATQVASPFLTPFKLALVAALFVAMPYILFQIWGFVAPGLYQHEKRFALPLLVSSILLFYLGMAFAYFVVFPLVFAFFSAVTPDDVAQMPDIAFYLEFVLKLFFAFGIAFEIPIATILLVAMGMTTPEDLASKRPYVIVGVFVIGMLLTPPDVISQTLLAIPMWMLYETGIFFSRFFLRDEGEETDAEAEEDAAEFAAGSWGAPEEEIAEDREATPTPAAPAPARPDSPPSDSRAGGKDVVGLDIAGGDPFDRERFRPMTEEEMDAELDALEAAERSPEKGSGTEAPRDLMETLLLEVQERRDREDEAGARERLYRVLAEGNDRQRQVALNILAQLDSD